MNHENTARRLSNQQRRYLISMIDGPHPYVECVQQGERWVRVKLFELGLLRHCTATGHSVTASVNFYCLSDDGRQVVCAILAEYAEALIAAELANQKPFNEVLTRVGYGRFAATGEPRHARQLEEA